MAYSEAELIGIQGSKGANHEIAVRQLYGDNAKIAYIPTFAELFAALRGHDIDRVVTAFSNTTITRPFVEEPYLDILSKDNIGRYWIDAKTRVKVRHHLLGIAGSRLDQITTVHTMDVARDQVKDTLHGLLPETSFVAEDDTALSAELISEWNDPEHAAIASPLAGEIYGLDVLVPDIQDNPNNRTTFLSLTLGSAATVIATGQENRTLMLLGLADSTKGSLRRALKPLDKNDINMSDIHTHSTPGSDERITQFLIESEAGFDSDQMRRAIEKMRKMGNVVNVLGSWEENTSTD